MGRGEEQGAKNLHLVEPLFFLTHFAQFVDFSFLTLLKGGEIRVEKRLLTQRQKIINALKDAGTDGMTNAELSKISLRYGGHIGNLYSQGYKIEKFNLDGGLYKYVLISEPADIKHYKNANEEIFEEIHEQYQDNITSDELKELLEVKHFHVVRKNGWYLQQFENEIFQKGEHL